MNPRHSKGFVFLATIVGVVTPACPQAGTHDAVMVLQEDSAHSIYFRTARSSAGEIREFWPKEYRALYQELYVGPDKEKASWDRTRNEQYDYFTYRGNTVVRLGLLDISRFLTVTDDGAFELTFWEHWQEKVPWELPSYEYLSWTIVFPPDFKVQDPELRGSGEWKREKNVVAVFATDVPYLDFTIRFRLGTTVPLALIERLRRGALSFHDLFRLSKATAEQARSEMTITHSGRNTTEQFVRTPLGIWTIQCQEELVVGQAAEANISFHPDIPRAWAEYMEKELGETKYTVAVDIREVPTVTAEVTSGGYRQVGAIGEEGEKNWTFSVKANRAFEKTSIDANLAWAIGNKTDLEAESKPIKITLAARKRDLKYRIEQFGSLLGTILNIAQMILTILGGLLLFVFYFNMKRGEGNSWQRFSSTVRSVVLRQ